MHHLVKSHNVKIASPYGIKQITTSQIFEKFWKKSISEGQLFLLQKANSDCQKLLMPARMHHLVKSHNVNIASPYGLKQITTVKRFKTYKVDTTMLKFEKSLF